MTDKEEKTDQEKLQEAFQRINAKRWPKCSKCGDEVLILTEANMCGPCDPPKVKVTVSQKKKDEAFVNEVLDSQESWTDL